MLNIKIANNYSRDAESSGGVLSSFLWVELVRQSCLTSCYPLWMISPFYTAHSRLDYCTNTPPCHYVLKIPYRHGWLIFDSTLTMGGGDKDGTVPPQWRAGFWGWGQSGVKFWLNFTKRPAAGVVCPHRFSCVQWKNHVFYVTWFGLMMNWTWLWKYSCHALCTTC